MTLKEFRQLHHNNDILHIGNVWDIQSALTMQMQGYKAIGTSSLAMANSLGYEDGEEMSFDELFQICKQITSKVKIPLTVDIEGGYSRDSREIVKNIISLYEIGVVGINIEDSVVKNGERRILSKESFSELLKEIASELETKNINIFINVRIDNFIMGLDNPLEGTLERIKSYELNSIDGIFVPCVVEDEDIKRIVKATTLPINIMTMPNLDDFKTLKSFGVKRLSQGPFLYNYIVDSFKDKLKKIDLDKSYKSLF